jgi:hypothetical protein
MAASRSDRSLPHRYAAAKSRNDPGGGELMRRAHRSRLDEFVPATTRVAVDGPDARANVRASSYATQGVESSVHEITGAWAKAGAAGS